MVKAKEIEVFLEKIDEGVLEIKNTQKDLIEPILEYLGDNEEDIIKYLKNIDYEQLDYIVGCFEAIYEKFPTVKMQSALENIEDGMLEY